MSSNNHIGPTRRGVTLVDSARGMTWLLVNTYGITVTSSGGILLVLATILYPPSLEPVLFAGLLLLSATVRHLGFPIGSITNSLFGVLDLTAILLLGPVAAAWEASLAVLLEASISLARRTARPTWTWIRLLLFNASLKVTMALAAGGLYLLLGGRLRPVDLSPMLLVPGLALISAWFVIDYGAWSVFQLLSGGRTRLLQWTRYHLVTALLVEFLPLPLAFLGAAIYSTLGAAGLLMGSLAVIMASLTVRLVGQARTRLEARVVELTTLNQVSAEIIRASQNEQDICEIVYRRATDVVDTTYFILGLIADDKESENLAVLVAEGVRQPSRSLPVGGVVTWMQQHRQPLVVSDLRTQALPFTARQVGDDAGLVRSALFVPMLAGQNLIGFMSIQSHLPNSFTADDTRILSAMANQAAMAIANLRLQRQAETQARLEREIRLARDIQRSLIPSSCPVVPGFDLAADWQSAREVSGDFYDFLALSRARLGIIIGDVSDKGVPAALFMALSRSLVRSGLLGASSPAEGLRRANRWIVKDTTSDMFLTLFYAVLDPQAHTLTYVNAGHNPPLICRRGDGSFYRLDEHGIALGMIEEAEYEAHTVSLEPGDLLVCYTDGVTEAVDAANEGFGEERLRQVISAHRDLPLQELIRKINEALRSHVGDRPAYDDATLVALRRVG